MVAPIVPVIALPPEEHNDGRAINAHLVQFDRYAKRFRSALALFDEARRRVELEESKRDSILDGISHAISLSEGGDIEHLKPLFSARSKLIREHHEITAIPSDWLFMAAQDAAMTIFHFGKTFDAIRKALERCPNLSTYVGNLSSELLASRIPDYRSVRNAVAHEAENLSVRSQSS